MTTDTRKLDRRRTSTHLQEKGPHGCDNYRSICITRVIYKIRPSLLAKRLAEILQLLTYTPPILLRNRNSNHRCDNENRTNTTRTPPHDYTNNADGPIRGMCHFEQHTTLGRPIQKGTPPNDTTNITRPPKHDTLMRRNGEVWKPVANNIGLFQGVAKCATNCNISRRHDARLAIPKRPGRTTKKVRHTTNAGKK